jgi:hypothetical protein
LIKQIKNGTEIQDGVHSKKCDFLLAVLDELEAKKDDNNVNSEELKVRAM